MKHTFAKRITSLLLTAAMLCSFAPTAFAADDPLPDSSTAVAVENTGGAEDGAVTNPASEEPSADNPDEDPAPNGHETSAAESVPAQVYDVQPDTEIPTLFATAKATYYIASYDAGGSDGAGDGSIDSPIMTINKVIATAKAADAESLEIVLLSDISSTLEIVFDNPDMPIRFTSNGGKHAIQYTGTAPIGSKSGFLKVVAGASVSFDNVTLSGSTGAYDARVLYVAEGAEVTLADATVTGGRVNNVLTNEGGAGAFVADRGMFTVGADVVFEDNETVAGGGAVFVADGGTVEISDNAKLQNNNAKLGGGLYADTQTHDYGGLSISGEVAVTGNVASENGSGMYVCADANASAQGNVTISGNTHGKNESNVYLSDGATLDIAGATIGANIGVSCAPEEAYRLVSLPDAYTIQPTVNGDEKGWHDDCGTWDVRYMTYQGQPGLYLYYKTLDMTFEDVRTLTGVQGRAISGDKADFLQQKDSMPNVSQTDGLLTVADTVAKNTPEDDDLVITITVDANDYRIPTEDIISVTSGGDVPFTYVPDFEHGMATITVDDAVVDTLTDTIEFGVTADKYYDLTVRMEGPLYTLASTITNHSENALVVSETSKVDTEASYKLTSGGNPVAGVEISLYEEGTDAMAGAKTTDADGVASFTGLNPTSSYYPILCYERVYRVISRDKVDLALSTLSGQNLAVACIKDAGAETGTVSYDAQAKTASITGITQDAKVTFSVEQAKDTITFNANEGDATTAPATLSMASKEMPAGATTYGNLATAVLAGYTFGGWYTEVEGGTLVESNSPYVTGVSARMLYAHWTANDDTTYKIQHWVEYADGGANARYEAGVTQTKEDGGATYYLYDETDYADGTSDAVKDITGLDLKTMSDPTITWWSRDGFTARFEQDCKVLADESAAFGIYYDRNTYELVFDPAGAGTATSTETVENKDVDFGALVGELPTPVLSGYEFGGWYDENDRLITDTTIYDKTENTNLTAHWNAKTDTKWEIKIAVQDITRDENNVCHAANTYTEYKTVYKANDESLLTGKTDTAMEFAISDIAALIFDGFKYTGYADAYDRNATNKTANTEKATVYIDPTDASTELNGKYNEAFDGGIVWLYYDRKTATVHYPAPDKPGENLGEDGDIIYGGDFTGQLPPAPGKDGHDFNGWEDENGNKITEDTPADEYVKDDGTVNVTPTWTPRNYRLTYVPGEKAIFVASDGGDGTASPSVGGGYLDSHVVTYDQPMGEMPVSTKPGYTFDGWFLEDGTQVKNDTVVTVDNVVIHKDDYSYEDTRPLYAHYTPNTYTLVLRPGASSVTGNMGTVNPARVTVTYDEIVSGMPVPQLKGYTFVSWLLDLKNPSTIVKNGDVWNVVYTNGAETPVYATWTPNSYKYTFDLNDATGSTRAALVDTTIDHTDEAFDSVYDGIFAVEAIRPGYTFHGWSLTADGNVLTADDLVTLAQDTTVYAQWEPKQFDVKFIMKGATMPESFDAENAVRDDAADTWTIKVKFDTTYGVLPVPNRADSKYHGWLADAPHWDEIDNEVILELPSYIDHLDAGGITLTAVMEPWITFDPDGNKFTDGTTDPKKELQSEITELPAVSKPDYTFDGWVTEEDKDKVLTVDDVKKLEEPTVLKPRFSANVTFNANGGKMRDNGLETLTIGLSKIKTLPSATRSSYNLSGWFTAAENGTQVTLASLVAANVPTTIYAHWSYAGGGGGGGGGFTSHTITVKEDEGANATPNGKVHVTDGNDTTIKIEAENGYVVTDVIVDGKSHGKLDEYTFEKVKKDHTLEIKVAKMLTGDHIAYIAGYPDGSVHPEAAITRAEAATVFYRLLSDEARKEYGTSESPFSDASGLWSSAAVGTLANAGIVNGYSNGTFRPDAAITRAEFAAIASRFDKLDGGAAAFSDVPSSYWAYKNIVSAATKGWVNGYSDGTFRPEQSITRAEVVKIVNAVLMRTADRDFIMKNSSAIRVFVDLSAMHWAYYEIMEAVHTHDYDYITNKETWKNLL